MFERSGHSANPRRHRRYCVNRLHRPSDTRQHARLACRSISECLAVIHILVGQPFCRPANPGPCLANAYFQYKIGILQDQDWAASLGDLEGNLSRPCGPMIWQLVRNCSGAEFRAIVDQIIDRLGNETTKIETDFQRKA